MDNWKSLVEKDKTLVQEEYVPRRGKRENNPYGTSMDIPPANPDLDSIMESMNAMKQKILSGSTIPTVYLSGPISNMPELNRPAFKKANEVLTKEGFEVIDPSLNSSLDTWEDYLKFDLPLVCKSDIVVLLDGWENSRGAKLEKFTADQLKIRVLRFNTLVDALAKLGGPVTKTSLDLLPDEVITNPHETPAEEAMRLVNGDRQDSYGHPYYDFSCTGEIWTALAKRYFPDKDIKFEPDHVAMFMMAVKMSREANRQKRDNITDIIGYAECYWKVLEKQKEVTQ